jgi:hypothetical protein
MPFVETPRGPVTFSLESRDELLDRIRHLDNGKPVAQAIERAGLADPVQLDLDGKRLVVEAVNLMSGEGEVDPQLAKLRDYLTDELTS